MSMEDPHPVVRLRIKNAATGREAPAEQRVTTAAPAGETRSARQTNELPATTSAGLPFSSAVRVQQAAGDRLR